MFCTTVTNTPAQWTPAGTSFGLPAAHPYHLPHYNPLNESDMGRKKKAAPSEDPNSQHPHRPPGNHNLSDAYQSSAPYVAPDPPRQAPMQQWGAPSALGTNTTSLPLRPQVPSHRQPPWNRVSEPTPQSLVDAWRSYRADHMQRQEPASPSGPAYNTQYWGAPIYQNQTWTAPQVSQFRPQAPAFQPGQSRYSLRSGQSNFRRPLSTATADQIVQSIETDSVQQPSHSPIRVRSPRKQGSRRPTPRREPTPINADVEPVPEPKAATSYLKHAQGPPKRLLPARKLLVLLDLNGTLVYRHGDRRQFSVKRPGVDRLLDYLFENHTVMIFTSATQRSAEKMARELLTPKQYGQLITIRCREHLGLKPEQFRNKVQVYKDLNKIWTAEEVKQSAHELATKWDMTNTVLIDDSVVKAKSHPHNLLQVSEFMHPTSNNKKAQQQWTQAETAVMQGVQAKLEALKYQASVACQIREWQNSEGSSPAGTSDKVDEALLDAIKEEATEVKEDPIGSKQPDVTADYPTPTSLARGVSSADEGDDDDDYDPEQWQGVKLPTPSDEGPLAVRKALSDRVAKTGETVRERSPSPVTAADFSWLVENKGDTKA